MEKVIKLEANQSYIITHFGNNNDLIFREPENCRYFASLVKKHLAPVAQILNCEMDRHRLEMKVRIYPEDQIPEKYRMKIHQPFSNLFNSYAKAFNKRYGRTGSLFRVRFRREEMPD